MVSAVSDRRYGPGAPPEWEPLIDDYMHTLAAAGQPKTTMTLRRIQLVRMARELGCRPDQLTGTRLVEWFGGRPDWTTETRRSNRAAVRCLLRWAYKTGRIGVHLADELPTVREKRGAPRPAPDHVWNQALIAASPLVALMLRLAGEA
ncbi:MAG: tyrosine-type recombinase/integrase, partial [Gemmatimonadales bacterium]